MSPQVRCLEEMLLGEGRGQGDDNVKKQPRSQGLGERRGSRAKEPRAHMGLACVNMQPGP